MSKKSFVLLALIMNTTICITLCIVLFTGTAGKISRNNIDNNDVENSKSLSDHERETEKESHAERPSNQAIVNIEDATMPGEEIETVDDAISEGENGDTIPEENTSEDETDPNVSNDSESIVEVRVESDTTPYNYKNNHQEETTDPIDEGGSVNENGGQNGDAQGGNNEAGEIIEDDTDPVPVNGTIAYLRGGCNIRSYRNVADNIIGYANEGETYRIEPSKCTATWVAIYVDDTTIGYLAADFCRIEP